MALCGFCGSYHFLASCTRVSYPDILIEGIKEKEAILENKGNNVHQLFSGNIFDVDSSDPYFAFRYIPEAGNQIGYCRLSGTRRTYECRNFTLVCCEGDVAQRFGTGCLRFILISETNLEEFDVITGGYLRRLCFRYGRLGKNTINTFYALVYFPCARSEEHQFINRGGYSGAHNNKE